MKKHYKGVWYNALTARIFENDLLNAIKQAYFELLELNMKIAAKKNAKRRAKRQPLTTDTQIALRTFINGQRKYTHQLTVAEARGLKQCATHLLAYLDKNYNV